MYKFISAIVGALVTIMIGFNGTLSNYIGNYLSTTIIHFIGLISITIILLVKGLRPRIYKDIPFYFYSGGILGIFPVLCNNLTFITLGASITLALGLLGQSLTSIIIDHYGLMAVETIEFKKEKLIGLFIISLGIIIMTIF